MVKQASLVPLICSLLLTCVDSKPAERHCDADASDINRHHAQSGFKHALLQVNFKEGQGRVQPHSEVLATQEQVCRVNEARPDLQPRHNTSYSDYFEFQGGQQGIFVFPPAKFAICLIEKNACSSWITNLLQPLLQNVTTLVDSADPDPPDAAVEYSIAMQSQRLFGAEGLNAVFQDPSANRVVFVREPLERFASTFLDKCLSSIDVQRRNCPHSVTRFSDMVAWALDNDLGAEINGHWMAQGSHCQLRSRLQDYNVIGLMTHETMDRDMRCILNRTGLGSFKIEKPRVNTGKMDTTLVLQKLFTPDAALRLIQHMKLDYELFGFPTPSWVAGATGEWYDIEQLLPAVASANFNWLPSAEDETDDLVELAHRAGYGRTQSL